MTVTPELKKCIQCDSLGCGIDICRFSGMTAEQFHDWQNAEGPERVRESLGVQMTLLAHLTLAAL